MLEHYIDLIAGKLKNGGAVYLCPAAMETILIAKMLHEKHGVFPTGFCDNDVRKQGKHLNSLPQLRIFSFDDALADEQAEFLVVSPLHSAEIMGNLVFERGVSKERILNYHELERRKTCALFAQNWCVVDRHFICCCYGGGMPLLDNMDFDPIKGVESLDKTRKELIDGSIPLPERCRTCFNNKDSYISVSRKLNSFNFSFRGWCNYKCSYCSSNQPDREGYNDRFFLEPYLVELEKNGMVNDIFSALFATGESCINEKRFPLYDHCGEKQYFMDVFSNCSVFDQSLFDLAHRSPVIIRKSFDAGTPETYAKIKGVNCYNKMLENVKHYLEAPYLVLNPKYLFVPGVNDNETDVKNFVEMCIQLNTDFVTPAFSFLDSEYYGSAHAKEMFKLLVDELAKNNIFTANVDTLFGEEYHKMYTASF